MTTDEQLLHDLNRALQPLFTEPPLWVSDSSELVDWLSAVGCNASIYSYELLKSAGMATSLPNVVAAFTSRDMIPSHPEWYDVFSASRVLLLPLLSFDPSLSAAQYGISKIAASDFVSAVKMNRQWLEVLGRESEPLRFSGAGTQFVCTVDEEATVLAPKLHADLETSEWVSVGSYLEVAMVSQADDIVPAFNVSGTFTVPGVAIAHHRQMADALLPLVDEAARVMHQLYLEGAFPIHIEVHNSHIVAARCNGRDLTEILARVSNPRRNLVLTEMGFGTNIGFGSADIDWQYNSQLNEGPIGIHIAVGDGLTGAHVDLVCPEVLLENLPIGSSL